MKKKVLLIVLMITLSTSCPVYCQLWKQYIDSAAMYNNKDDINKRITFYNKARELLQKDSMSSLIYSTVCDSISVNIYQMSGTTDIINFWRQERQLRENVLGKQSKNYAISCLRLGFNLMQKEQNYSDAIAFLSEAINILEKIEGNQTPDYAAACATLGVTYDNLSQFLEAENFLLKAKDIRKKYFGNQHIIYANTCRYLAHLYLSMGQYDKALPLYQEGLALTEKNLGKQNSQYAYSCSTLGELYLTIDQYDKAEQLLLESKQIIENIAPDKMLVDNYMSCYGALGNLYTAIGQYEKAEVLLKEGKHLIEKISGKDNLYYAVLCQNLGNLYIISGQIEKASLFYEEYKQIIETNYGKNNDYYGHACESLATVSLYLNGLDKAEKLYIEAKEVMQKVLGKEHPDYSQLCESLANLYYYRKQYGKAMSLNMEAKQNLEKSVGKKHDMYATACYYLGIDFQYMNKPFLADQNFKELFAANEFNVKTVFRFTNEKEKNFFIETLSDRDDDIYSFYTSKKNHPELPFSLSLFYRNLVLSASRDLQKQLFYTGDTSLINKYNEWVNLKKYLAVLYAMPEKERKENISILEDKTGSMEKELSRLSASFKKQQQKTGWKDIHNKLKNGEAAIEFVEFKDNTKRYITSYIALVLRKDEPLPILVKLFIKDQLDSLLVNFGNKTSNDGITELYASRGVIVKGNNNIETSKSVYSLVWKPLEKELKGISTIYFAPAGLLHRISFAALPINKNELLSDKYKLVQLATTAAVTDQTPVFITASDSLRLYGGINYDADSTSLKQSILLYANNNQQENSRSLPSDLTRSNSFNYLAGTATEIKTIQEESESIRTFSLTGVDATEESFKAMNGKASPAVIHIATHGFFFPDPKAEKQKDFQPASETGQVFRQSDNPLFRSGLLFAGANNAWQGKPINGMEDGILTAYEVSNMYLPNTKLAVLSACETALGDIQGSEGVYGLQRAFKIAGVQNLVMSLWKVPDAETAEFMQLFYKNMFDKQSISEAFYNAQTKMKNKYRNDPYKWAAWVLVR